MFVAIGCTSAKPPAALPAQQRAIIDVGQPWADAMAVAERAGYSIHEADPIPVEWLPQPTGFVLKLNEEFELYVIKDKLTGTVQGLSLVSHPIKPKSSRDDLSFTSFALPSAPKGGG